MLCAFVPSYARCAPSRRGDSRRAAADFESSIGQELEGRGWDIGERRVFLLLLLLNCAVGPQAGSEARALGNTKV